MLARAVRNSSLSRLLVPRRDIHPGRMPPTGIGNKILAISAGSKDREWKSLSWPTKSNGPSHKWGSAIESIGHAGTNAILVGSLCITNNILLGIMSYCVAHYIFLRMAKNDSQELRSIIKSKYKINMDLISDFKSLSTDIDRHTLLHIVLIPDDIKVISSLLSCYDNDEYRLTGLRIITKIVGDMDLNTEDVALIISYFNDDNYRILALESVINLTKPLHTQDIGRLINFFDYDDARFRAVNILIR